MISEFSSKWNTIKFNFRTPENWCNLPKIQGKRPNLCIFLRKEANGIANSADPDQTAPLGARVGTSIVQPVNSSGKCRIMPARQILQKSLKWQILALINKIELKHPKRFAFSTC